MAAHRYWRVLGIESYSADLELSEFQLLSGAARVDAPATLTANIAPVTGSTADLKDDNLATGASWGASSLATLVLSWDFGSGGAVDVTDIRLGSAVDPSRFLITCKLQYSDDAATWTDAFPAFLGTAWPGPRAKTASEAVGGWNRGPNICVNLSAGGSIATLMTANNAAPRAATPSRFRGVLQVECEWINVSLSGTTAAVGILTPEAMNAANSTLGNTAGSWAYLSDGTKRANSSGVTYGAAYTLNDTIGMVIDFAAGSITFYKNGASQGVAYTGLTSLELYAAAQTFNYGPLYQVRCRTKGFTYPVAGATPWEERDTSITQSKARGRMRIDTPERKPSNLSVAMPLQMKVEEVARARPDYLTGVLGKGVGRLRGFTLDYLNPLNKPYRCLVRLVRESDGLVMRAQWSAADGSYDFQYIDEMQSYTILAYYQAHGKRAVLTDGLTLANGKVELMA